MIHKNYKLIDWTKIGKEIGILPHYFFLDRTWNEVLKVFRRWWHIALKRRKKWSQHLNIIVFHISKYLIISGILICQSVVSTNFFFPDGGWTTVPHTCEYSFTPPKVARTMISKHNFLSVRTLEVRFTEEKTIIY